MGGWWAQIRARIRDVSPGVQIRTLYSLDMRTRYCPTDAFAEGCGEFVRSDTVTDTDALIYFPPESAKSNSCLEKTRADIAAHIFGSERDAFIHSDFMIRRSAENRRPRESGVTFGVLARKAVRGGKPDVLSSGAESWSSARLVRDGMLMDVPWNTWVWKVQAGDEEENEAPSVEAQAQDADPNYCARRVRNRPVVRRRFC